MRPSMAFLESGLTTRHFCDPLPSPPSNFIVILLAILRLRYISDIVNCVCLSAVFQICVLFSLSFSLCLFLFFVLVVGFFLFLHSDQCVIYLLKLYFY